jgi:hypothetical protein
MANKDPKVKQGPKVLRVSKDLRVKLGQQELLYNHLKELLD